MNSEEDSYQDNVSIRMYERSTEDSVLVRSLSCELDWPTFSQVSKKERDFPIAYFMTVYTDPR